MKYIGYKMYTKIDVTEQLTHVYIKTSPITRDKVRKYICNPIENLMDRRDFQDYIYIDL